LCYCHGLADDNFLCIQTLNGGGDGGGEFTTQVYESPPTSTTYRTTSSWNLRTRPGPVFIPFHRVIKVADTTKDKPNIMLVTKQVKVCDCRRRCDFSHTLWEGECIRDPTAAAYESPHIRNNNSMRIVINLTLKSSLTLVLTEEEEKSQDIWIETFSDIFSRILNKTDLRSEA
jgi:hypothetical protein